MYGVTSVARDGRVASRCRASKTRIWVLGLIIVENLVEKEGVQACVRAGAARCSCDVTGRSLEAGRRRGGERCGGRLR